MRFTPTVTVSSTEAIEIAIGQSKEAIDIAIGRSTEAIAIAIARIEDDQSESETSSYPQGQVQV